MPHSVAPCSRAYPQGHVMSDEKAFNKAIQERKTSGAPLSAKTTSLLQGLLDANRSHEGAPLLSDDLLERGYIEGWALALTFATEEEWRAGRYSTAIACLVLSIMIQ